MKTFWTEKRIETVSKIFLNIGQAIVVAAIISGLLEKVGSVSLKVFLIAGTSISLALGVVLSDIKRTAKGV